MELFIKGRSHQRLSLLVVSGHLCAPGQIGGFFGHQYLQKESIYTFVLAIAILAIFFIYFLASFIKLFTSPFSYDLLIKSPIYFASQFLRLP